jgi:hypothetical protein
MADGMFMTPQMARQAAIQAGMISPQQMGSQGLLQQVISTMANAGTGVGAGIGGLFGAEYAPERQARMTQEVMQAAGQKYASPAAQAQEASRLFSSMNMPMQAQAMQERYMKLAPMEQAERDKQDVITGRANLLMAKGMSAEDAQRIARDDVTFKEMIASKKSDANLGLSTNQRIAAKSLGLPVYTDINKYTTEQAQAIEKKMNEQANSVAKNGAVTVTIEDKGSLKGAEELGKLDAQQVDEWRKAGDQADRALSNLDRMEKAAIGGVYSGPQAGSTLVIANFLDSLGLLQGEALEKLTRSASYDKTAKESVLQAIGGSLGNQVSDADRKFIEAIVPQLATNPQAKIELIRVMKHINKQAQEKARVSSEWFYNNDYSLRGFQWKSKPYAPYSDLSDAELDAQIKALQKQ